MTNKKMIEFSGNFAQFWKYQYLKNKKHQNTGGTLVLFTSWYCSFLILLAFERLQNLFIHLLFTEQYQSTPPPLCEH